MIPNASETCAAATFPSQAAADASPRKGLWVKTSEESGSETRVAAPGHVLGIQRVMCVVGCVAVVQLLHLRGDSVKFVYFT